MKKDIDIAIGNKIKIRRVSIGMSQTTLANEVGVTFQQIQKYESGANSLNLHRIEQISKALKVSSSYFFENDYCNTNKNASTYDSNYSVSEREILEIVKAFQRINSPIIRKKISDLTRSLTDTD